MAPRVAVFALLAVLAAGSRVQEEMWGPADGVKAFSAIENVLSKVLNTHMTAEQKTKAEHVCSDVRAAVAAVEDKKSNLTKAEKNAKMGAAIQELAGLQGEYKQRVEVAQAHEGKVMDMGKLQKELAEKKEELLKDEAKIKLFTLQKELIEKKLALQRLIEKKQQGESTKKAQAEDAAAEGALAAKVLKVVPDLEKLTDKKANLTAPIVAALTEVQARSKKESDALAKMDADNKKTMGELDAAMKKSKGKESQMMRGLKKQEHREYMKARVQRQNQLTELKSVEQSIEQHDAKKLKTTLSKMKHEVEAHGDFLH